MPRRLPLLAFVLAGYAIITPQVARAQSADSSSNPVRRGWLYIGIGLGTAEGIDSDAGAALLSVNYQRGPHLFSAGVVYIFEILGYSSTDLGLLYGRALSWPWGHASLSAGVAFTWTSNTEFVFSQEGGFLEYTKTSLGIPLQVQVWVAPFPDTLPIGIGVAGFANLNHMRSFAGATFGLIIGGDLVTDR